MRTEKIENISTLVIRQHSMKKFLSISLCGLRKRKWYLQADKINTFYPPSRPAEKYELASTIFENFFFWGGGDVNLLHH